LRMGKKSSSKDEVMAEGEEPRTEVSVIAQPLADKKLSKKVHKLVKASAKVKRLKRGVKEVVKTIRKGSGGKRMLCVIAGDISPIDVITHLPVLCEENDVPYVYVASKTALGAASTSKRPTSCVLVTAEGKVAQGKEEEKDLKEALKEAIAGVTAVTPTWR